MSTEDANGSIDNPEIEGVHNRMNALAKRISRLEDQLEDERERADGFNAELEDERRRREELQERVAELEGRTDLLQFVQGADDTKGEQRSLALLMHAQRKIDADPNAHRYRIDRERAEEILHHPDIDRTTYYTDMDRCERWVGDTDVVSYSDGVLKIDLSAGEIESTIQQQSPGGSR